MELLSLEQRITLIKTYYSGQSVKEIKDAFVAIYEYRELPAESTFRRVVDKFNRTGSVRLKSDDPIPEINVNEDRTEIVLAAVAADPKTSLSKIEADTGVPKTTAFRILHSQKFKAYKLQRHQELLNADLEKRIEFCQILVDRMNTNRNFSLNLCFTDECSFTLHNEPNTQNTRLWATENPHQFVATRTQYPQKVNVWTGICRGSIIGPFFIEGNLTGATYLELLQNNIVPALEQLNLNIPDIIFQHDGCPSHSTRLVREFLNETFTEWIGRGGTVGWPPRSPDLAPCDFFLWGHVKNNIYKTKPQDINELKQRIRDECGRINIRMLANVRQEFYDRLHYCLAENGNIFEHLL